MLDPKKIECNNIKSQIISWSSYKAPHITFEASMVGVQWRKWMHNHPAVLENKTQTFCHPERAEKYHSDDKLLMLKGSILWIPISKRSLIRFHKTLCFGPFLSPAGSTRMTTKKRTPLVLSRSRSKHRSDWRWPWINLGVLTGAHSNWLNCSHRSVPSNVNTPNICKYSIIM